MASKDKGKVNTKTGKGLSFRTAATVAELYPAHTQKKIGPIGRKKLQGNEVRRRRTRSFVTPDDDGENSNKIEQPSAEDVGNEKSEHENIAASVDVSDDETNKTDKEPPPVDNVTGVPMESVWFRMNSKKTDEDNNKNLFQVSTAKCSSISCSIVALLFVCRRSTMMDLVILMDGMSKRQAGH